MRGPRGRSNGGTPPRWRRGCRPPVGRVRRRTGRSGRGHRNTRSMLHFRPRDGSVSVSGGAGRSVIRPFQRRLGRSGRLRGLGLNPMRRDDGMRLTRSHRRGAGFERRRRRRCRMRSPRQGLAARTHLYGGGEMGMHVLPRAARTHPFGRVACSPRSFRHRRLGRRRRSGDRHRWRMLWVLGHSLRVSFFVMVGGMRSRGLGRARMSSPVRFRGERFA